MNTFPNEENYNETPITRRSNFFNENLKDTFSGYDEEIVNIAHDAYCVSIDEDFVINYLDYNNNGDFIDIYEVIITQARREIILASERYDKAWEEQATNILHFYQGKLFTTLTNHMKMYCMDI